MYPELEKVLVGCETGVVAKDFQQTRVGHPDFRSDIFHLNAVFDVQHHD